MRFALRLGSVGFAIALTAATRAEAPTPKPPPAPSPSTTAPATLTNPGVPVTFDGEVLYSVHDFMGILSPEDRARLAEKKIQELADDPFYTEDQFATDEFRGTTRILYGGTPLGLVSDDDAEAAHATRDELASMRIHAVSDAIARRRARQLPG